MTWVLTRPEARRADEDGSMTEVVNADGNITRVAYADDNMTRVVIADGDITRFAYADGNMTILGYRHSQKVLPLVSKCFSPYLRTAANVCLAAILHMPRSSTSMLSPSLQLSFISS